LVNLVLKLINLSKKSTILKNKQTSQSKLTQGLPIRESQTRTLIAADIQTNSSELKKFHKFYSHSSIWSLN